MIGITWSDSRRAREAKETIMITQNDLLDLKFVFCNIRLIPQFPLNDIILSTLIDALDSPIDGDNKIRKLLLSLDIHGNENWSFVKHPNVYSYTVAIKDPNVYYVLGYSLRYLLNCIKQKNYTKASVVADTLHNLPAYICENAYKIPKSFYKHEVKWFRKNFDRNFLR